MTIKPQKLNRTEWEKKDTEKLQYLKRKQEEKEVKKSLQDFLKHLREELDDSTPH